MPANVESLFYVSNEANSRFTPWHGLGTPVEEALKSAEAIQMAGLNWTVDARPVYDSFQKEIEGYKANVRSSDNSVLGIVSDKYKIVQNEEAFEFTDSLIGDEVKYETAGSLKEGKLVWLLAKMPERKILDDKFDPYICFSNQHDGKGAIKVCMTPIRVVCNNTLNLALDTAKRTWSTKHMGDMQSKLEEARETLGFAHDYLEALNEEANRLSEVKVSDSELEAIFDAMYPIDYDKDTNRKIKNITDMKTKLFNCYEMNDISQYKGTAWGIVNAATDMADHATPQRFSENFEENRWSVVMFGHPFVDAIYKRLVDIKSINV